MIQSPDESFDQVVSLGGMCFVKYQVALDRYRRAGRDPADIRAFEAALYGHDRAVFPRGNDLFDWLVTPADALGFVLRQGVSAAFTREGLRLNAAGSVEDGASGIVYHHAFTRTKGVVLPETLAAEHAAQLAKHRHLEAKFLERCASGQRVLYIRSDGAGHREGLAATRRFAELLRAAHPEHRFHILYVPLVAAPRGRVESAGLVTVHELSKANAKRPAAQWQGANEVWAPLLASIRLAGDPAPEAALVAPSLVAPSLVAPSLVAPAGSQDRPAPPPPAPPPHLPRGRILFYGGCHAAALGRIYTRFAAGSGLGFDTLINFEIIGRGTPFDHDAVARYDAVVFSPIENKPGYETKRLEDACARHGTRAISYPWLEWRGYHPFSAKGPFVTSLAWLYPDVLALAREAPDEAAAEAAVAGFFGRRAEVEAALARTTEHLSAHEARNGCTLRVSGFVQAQFRKARLFLTPDHPGKPLYDMLVRALNAELGIPFDDAAFAAAPEPQYGIKLPIHPRVAELLDLEFRDPDYQNILSDFGPRILPLPDYLRLCRGLALGHAVVRSTSATYLKRRPVPSGELAAAEKILLPPASLLQAGLEPLRDKGNHARLRLNWASAPALRGLAWDEAFIFRPHWELRAAAPSR